MRNLNIALRSLFKKERHNMTKILSLSVGLAVALVLLVVLAVCTNRFVRARIAKTRNARAGSTPEGEEARICAEAEEIVRSIIEDFTK